MLFIVSSILPAPWQRENCMQSSPAVTRNWWDTKRGHYASCFSNHGTFWSTLYGDEWWRGWGGGVLCRSVGVRVVQALMVPHEMSTICKQFVSQQSLKAGSTCICVCLYIFLWIPSLLLTVLATLSWSDLDHFASSMGFLDVFWFVTDFVFLGERLIDNLYPHKLRWIFRDSWKSIFNVLRLSPSSFFWCLYWGLAGWQHCLFGCLWRLVGGKCLVQSPLAPDFWVETCCISGFVSHILTRCFGFCFGQNSLAWLRQKSKYLGSVYIPMTPWCAGV